jgi:hypothetical protein
MTDSMLASVAITTGTRLQHRHRIDMVIDGGSTSYQVAGPLTNHLNPKRWRSFQGKFSSVDFISEHPLAGYLRSNDSASIISQAQATNGTVTARIHAIAPTVIKSTLAYAPGWYAQTTSGHGLHLFASSGLISVTIPQGMTSLVLSYRAPKLTGALALGAFSTLILVCVVGFAWYDNRRSISRSQ